MDELVTRTQMISYCASTAAIAIVGSWALARPDVLSLNLKLDDINAKLHKLETQHNQTQTVTIAGKPTRDVVADLAKQIVDRNLTDGVYATGMRGTVRNAGVSASTTGAGSGGTGGSTGEPGGHRKPAGNQPDAD